MGWGRMLLLGNVGQQLDIQDAEAALAALRREVESASQADASLARRLELLSAENAELKLYLAAVIRLLVAKGTVTEPELRLIVDSLDRGDGRADGRYEGRLRPS
jgi:hypothetical protein